MNQQLNIQKEEDKRLKELLINLLIIFFNKKM